MVFSEVEGTLITYFTCGYPDLETSEKIFSSLASAGSDIIEVGVPFSDPMADGKTIQKASEVALKAGFKVDDVFKLCSRISKLGVPLVVMSYYNIVLRRRISWFLGKLKSSGVDGIIVPDLPPEEAGELLEEARKSDLKVIFLAAPTTPPERLKIIDSVSSGFIYYVSVTGVTGARDKLPDELMDNLRMVKGIVKKPVVVGFGVSKPEQVSQICRIADGVVVGSAIVDRIRWGLDELKKFVKSLKLATIR